MAQGWLRAKIYDCYGGAAGEWRNVIAARSLGRRGGGGGDARTRVSLEGTRNMGLIARLIRSLFRFLGHRDHPSPPRKKRR